MGPIEYYDIAAQATTTPPPPPPRGHFTAETRHWGVEASLGVLQT
jgi:hypothetical protein